MAYIICFHKWSKWSELVNCYAAPYQFAHCEKCNKIISRRHSLTGNEVNLTMWNHKPETNPTSEAV